MSTRHPGESSGENEPKRVKLTAEMPPPSDPRMPTFDSGLFLAPMVRIGSLPSRLLALEYGADLVWSPEIVDRAIMGTTRRVNAVTGLVEYIKGDKPIFSCHPIERPYLIYQVGSSTPEHAAEAVRIVTEHDDVAGVDLNCGCPKPFSTLGGMGANLLTEPDLLCEVLRQMRCAAPPHVSVTCKIRLLPTQAETLALVEQIVRTRTIRALTIHCRTKPMRPREPALIDRFQQVAAHVSKVAAETGQDVPVIYNGDCFGASDAPRIRSRTGASAVMMARAAELNPSCFQLQRQCVAKVIAPRWLQYAVLFDNPFGNTKYCVTQLAFTTWAGARESDGERVSPLPKRELVRIRSELSQSRTHEDMARTLGLPWPLDTAEALEPLRRALAAR
ncbi:tRNA-dihydrouridine(20) synthase [NAD(P)(+)] [Malassezia nana]|uniref:tRNA-dihydrouridine(20) synthase [NAD(P)(+)] n=1 Tax=Malassezia nana TaxID=180528 RepID=A0AAF0EJW2_9BASI|nr:tRNA-dihydrouridine(20) synthase [NAD(P)(+)] [Malassezia nana]